MLPLETADQLRAHYGDFFHAISRALIQALQKMQASVLVAGRENTKRALSEAGWPWSKNRISPWSNSLGRAFR